MLVLVYLRREGDRGQTTMRAIAMQGGRSMRGLSMTTSTGTRSASARSICSAMNSARRSGSRSGSRSGTRSTRRRRPRRRSNTKAIAIAAMSRSTTVSGAGTTSSARRASGRKGGAIA